MSGPREVVEFIIPWLVDNVEAIRVNEAAGGERALIIDVYVDSEEMGKVIGRGGRLARSIRSLAKAAAVRDGNNAVVEFLEA